ncbi:hypothetical protein L228DRAFT_243656 [Xylona heveae TC161]|uniref:Uncharacterized protein n=1 Tax=Xylona heveae (strain CBS 132557 / TC161) TaxID=1328760 RepID=A0A165IHL6_XYLHT|nr:hypothetical protein L228DRAFT_243656 [Xylona heveae TC161]KZF24909.1 hypothetical protein L228DRAFT_243656 [Xylona heveae TC161]
MSTCAEIWAIHPRWPSFPVQQWFSPLKFLVFVFAAPSDSFLQQNPTSVASDQCPDIDFSFQLEILFSSSHSELTCCERDSFRARYWQFLTD